MTTLLLLASQGWLGGVAQVGAQEASTYAFPINTGNGPDLTSEQFGELVQLVQTTPNISSPGSAVLTDAFMNETTVVFTFDIPLNATQEQSLEELVENFVPTPPLGTFLQALPDANATLSFKQLSVALLWVSGEATQNNTYELPEAADLFAAGFTTGSFALMNDGTGEVTVAVSTALGQSNLEFGQMRVPPSTASQFRYRAINTTEGGEAYALACTAGGGTNTNALIMM